MEADDDRYTIDVVDDLEGKYAEFANTLKALTFLLVGLLVLAAIVFVFFF